MRLPVRVLPQAPQEYLDQYKNIADPSRRAYAAMITAVDDQIGRVLDALDKKAMRARLALPPALPDHDYEFDTEQ